LSQLTSAVFLPSPIEDVQWFSRQRLTILFWIGAFATIVVMASLGPVGWDAHGYWKTSQAVRDHFDPYAQDLVALQAFHDHINPAEPPPFVYVYSPLTLSLLRPLSVLPSFLLGLLYWGAFAAGAMLELWAGFQMAEARERRWLALALPAVVFFPGLLTDDVILSGNVAYVLYGVILAASTVGWKRGHWRWFYIAVLAASVIKAPFLALLAFPVLVDRDSDQPQWVPALATAAVGVLLFAAQMRFWPSMFREQLLSLRLIFDWLHDFGYGPVSILGKAMLRQGILSTRSTAIFYLGSACVLAPILLFLAQRVRQWNLPRETWVPVALVGTVLLNPRIQKYDFAAITIPMLLIGWRAVRFACARAAETERYNSDQSPAASARSLILAAVGCFLIANAITIAGPSWFPVELVVLLAIFALGVWSLVQSRVAVQSPLEDRLEDRLTVCLMPAD
jgi:hypothetical protein